MLPTKNFHDLECDKCGGTNIETVYSDPPRKEPERRKMSQGLFSNITTNLVHIIQRVTLTCKDCGYSVEHTY